MKTILSRAKTVLMLLIITVISLCFYTYMLVRPVSYGMSYTNNMEYDGYTFNATMTFYPDGTMKNFNMNYDDEVESFYYYKDGYVFITMATTEEEYREEIEYINENFEKAIKTPFYGAKINAFNIVYEGILDYDSVFTCNSAITFAIVGGVVGLIMIVLTAVSAILWITDKRKYSNKIEAKE